jgi:hypothetical protein
MKKSKPTPSTPPGRNSFGRTYEEQMDFESSQRAKNIGKGEKNIFEMISTKKPALKKGETLKVMKGSPNMAKRVALKKKMGK